MDRRTFLLGASALPVLTLASRPLAHAQDPAAATEQAPIAPAGAQGLLVANRATGFTGPLEKRALQALFRGMTQTAPAGHRVLIYVLPPNAPAQVAVLDGTVGWSESAFERQAPIVESSLGRPLFKRMAGSAEVLAAVAADPGGVGILSPDTLLVPGVVILWPGGAP